MNKERIEEILKRLGSEDIPEDVHKIAEEESESFSRTLTPSRQHILWSDIMKSRITKLAAAAMTIMAVVVIINQFSGSANKSNAVWADVITHTEKVDFFHFYGLVCSDDVFEAKREGWYAHGKMVGRDKNGYTYYDDGEWMKIFDKHKTSAGKYPSQLPERVDDFFKIATRGLLSKDNEKLGQQKPAYVGDDFLIYSFEPPKEDENWIEKITVTVGVNSLLPVQIKTYTKAVGEMKAGYELTIIDYEAPEKMAEFFTPPTQDDRKEPHGRGEVVLDGEEVEIDIQDAPGISKAVVRLHDKYEGPSDRIYLPLRERYEREGGPVYFLDVYFITEEGYQSIVNDHIILWPNEGMKCGLGADNWPDGKYRNIRFTPVIEPTDQEDIFVIEISCWMITKE